MYSSSCCFNVCSAIVQQTEKEIDVPVEKSTEDKPDEAEDKEESKDDDGASDVCIVTVP